MLIPFSQAETAFRDTLITKAEGVALDTLGIMYGFPRLGIFERKYYRRALREVAFGKRGTYRLFFKVLENLFDQYSERRGRINVTLDPSDPHVLIYREGGAPTFDCSTVQRFIRVESPTFGSKIYYSQGLADGKLKLNPIDNPAIAGADWSDLNAPEEGTAKILGFMLRERHPGPASVDGYDLNGNPWHPISRSQDPAAFAEETYLSKNTCTIDLFIDSFLWSTPPTYLQEDGTIDRTIIAPNQPFGGHLMSLFDAANRAIVDYDPSGVASEVHPESGSQEVGPFPIYLDAEGKIAGAFLTVLDNLLASGVHLTAEIKDWCELLGEGVFNPFGNNFDLGNGGQGLPENWDFDKHGVPREIPNTKIETAEHVNEFLIFADAQGTKAYAEEKANLALSNTGAIILDDDTLYFLIAIIDGNQSAITLAENTDVLRVDSLGRVLDLSRTNLGIVPLATFETNQGIDASSELVDIAGTVLKAETAASGTAIIQEPGANRTDNDDSTPDTISRMLPDTLDLYGAGIAGFLQLRAGNGDLHWSQNVKILLDENRKITTTAGFPIYPHITVSPNVNTVIIKENGMVFEDTGNGATMIGVLNIGVFANPKGLFPLEDNIFKESTAVLQPLEHRRSGPPTVGAGFSTATRGRLKINGTIGGGLIRFDGRDNVVQVVPV
tara:strand:- start:227 stop:2230 length:2004 start_codon:yes stop_codon:yes gene_type:complete